MKVTLKDGSVKEYSEPMSVNDIAFDIAGGLGRAACAGEVDGEVVDLRTTIDKDCTLNILTFKDEAGKAAYRHTASHVMAEAVKNLFPEAKLAIGPSIDTGFYYDFEHEPFSREDLDKIEAEMKKIIKKGARLERFTLPREDAIKYMEDRNEPYKVELIKDLPEDSTISFYSQGEFVDLCAGPHLMNTKSIKAFKIISSSMAYWRGDSSKARLQRIYATAFDSKDELNKYLEELEEALIMSDVGANTSATIINNLRERVKKENIKDEQGVREALRKEIQEIFDATDNTLKLETKPAVILVVGVNGVGKTTSIGKIANKLKKDGKKVVVAAADTFRAAAVEQLEIWANRVGCDIVKREEGVDPASVVYDAIKITKEKNADVLICDTAGRLHNKKYLMDELIKIKKVIDKELPDSSEEVLMVLDATTGQNAISQVQAFKETVDITGIVLTKLDGTAKGGAVIGIVNENKVPVKFIGVGEQVDDMEIFNSEDFVKALI